MATGATVVDLSTSVDDTSVDTSVDTTQVADSTNVDTPNTPVDDVPVDSTSTDTSTDDQDTQVDGDNLPLYKQAKGALEKIKAENPALAKKITAALIRDGQISKSLPEGFEKAAQVVKDVSSLAYPGQEGQTTDQIISAVKAEVQGWRDFDVKLSNGDPTVLEEYVSAAPEGFQNLIPAALDRYAQLNPEGYSTLVTKAVVQDMQAAEIPLQMRLLATFIPRLPDSPEKQEIITAYNSLTQWVNKLGEWAKKPIASVKGQNNPEQPQNQEQVYQQREMELTRREYNAASTGYGNRLIDTEAAKYLGAAKATDKQKQQIAAKVAEELDARLSMNEDYKKAMRAFLAAKNQEGYKRRLHSEYQKLIPGAVRRAIDDLGLKPAAVPAQKPAVQKPAPQGRPATPVSDGFEKISGHPRTVPGMNRIDLTRTTTEMLTSGKAILVGGRKVRWK